MFSTTQFSTIWLIIWRNHSFSVLSHKTILWSCGKILSSILSCTKSSWAKEFSLYISNESNSRSSPVACELLEVKVTQNRQIKGQELNAYDSPIHATVILNSKVGTSMLLKAYCCESRQSGNFPLIVVCKVGFQSLIIHMLEVITSLSVTFWTLRSDKIPEPLLSNGRSEEIIDSNTAKW